MSFESSAKFSPLAVRDAQSYRFFKICMDDVGHGFFVKVVYIIYDYDFSLSRSTLLTISPGRRTSTTVKLPEVVWLAGLRPSQFLSILRFAPVCFYVF